MLRLETRLPLEDFLYEIVAKHKVWRNINKNFKYRRLDGPIIRQLAIQFECNSSKFERETSFATVSICLLDFSGVGFACVFSFKV